MEKILKYWEEKAKAAEDDWINEKTKAILIEMLEINGNTWRTQ